MRSEEYVVLQGWMYAIDLTDKQRLTYAIIWGYSRDGRSVCRTTAKQLAEWLGCTERNVKYIVRQLEDRGLIGHEVVAVSARRGHAAGVMTDFWAVLPEDAEKPGKKARIDWAGRAKVGKPISLPGREADFPTPITVSRYSYINHGGGKNSARRARETTTTTTGFLFENDELSGLTPGDSARVRLPWTGKPFREAWEMLLRQPSWQGKTPEALQIALDTLEMVCSPDEAVYIVRLAISKGWDSIKDPSRIIAKDADIIPRYPASTWEGADNE